MTDECEYCSPSDLHCVWCGKSEDTKDPDHWKNHWVGMPEFVQEKVEPHAKIIVRFANEDDLQEFAKMIGQKLTNKTKSIWHPYRPHSLPNKMVWKDDD